MTHSATCGRCGGALSRHAPAGLCPRCLLESALGEPAAAAQAHSQEASSPHPSPPSDGGEGARRAGEEAVPFSEATGSAAQSPPQRIGDYELLECLGYGGMGVVYKARQPGLNRMVALKMLPFGRFTREDFVKRFRIEAEAAAQLQHPNIVAIHEVGERDGQHYFAMEWIQGPNLAEALHDQPMPVARAVRLTRAIAEAVQYAHEHAILHRDLKPSNVLLDELDQPHITDFGLAKNLRTDSELTLSGQTLGSPQYAPPELAEGRTRDACPSSDVYSLGALLYHLLTGRPPFVGESMPAVLEQVVRREPVSPRLLNPAVSHDLETICLKCLEKEPVRRYPTAQELAEELARFQRDEPILARPAGALERAWRWCRRRPALSASLSAALMFLVAGLLATSWQWRRAERHAGDLSATVTRLKLDQAEERINGRETAEGLALLAALLRENATNRVAAQRIVSILTQRNVFRPLVGSAELWHSRWTTPFAQHGDLSITTTNNGRTLLLWDTRDGWNLKRSIEVGEPVRHSTFSRDGRLLLAATHEKSLRLYDLADGSLLAGPHPINGFTDHLLLAPDNAHAIAIAGPDDALSSWRRIKGMVVRLSDGKRLHEGIQFHWAAFSHDGRRVITANSRSAQVRDAVTWQPAGKALTEPEHINTAEFSPDSARIVTAGANSDVHVWDAASGERLFRLAHSVNVQHASFSPDGKYIFTRDNANNGRLWDTATGKMIGDVFPQQKGYGPTSFSPDGRSLLSYSRSTITLREVETTLPLAEPLVMGGVPTRARFLPDGRRIVVTTMDGSARMWDTASTASGPQIFPERMEMIDGRLSPDGRKVAIAIKSNWGRLWNVETSEPVEPYLLHNPGAIRTVRWSADSRFFVTAANDKTALVRDGGTGLQIGEPLRHNSPVTYAEFSRDGRWLATASEDNTARIWNALNHQATGPSLKHQNAVSRARFSPDGKLLATASQDRTVRIWSVPDGREVGPAITNELEFSDAVFSPDSTRLGTAGNASFAQLWDVRTRRELTPPLRHASRVTTIRFSADGRRVATASTDATARVWDANTGQPVARPLRHREEVTLAEFSPDGRFVLTASIDGTARLWDAATGHAVSDSFEHDERIVAGEWANDGRSFLTASYDRRAKLWPIFLVPECSAPSWLADLAEAIGLVRVEGDQIFQPVSVAQAVAAFERMEIVPANDAWGTWLHSFLEPRERRSVRNIPAQP